MNQADTQQNNQYYGYPPAQYPQYPQNMQYGSPKPQNDQFNKGFFVFYKVILCLFCLYTVYCITSITWYLVNESLSLYSYFMDQLLSFLSLYGSFMAYQAMRHEDIKKSKMAVMMFCIKLALYFIFIAINMIRYEGLWELLLPTVIIYTALFIGLVLSGAVKIHLTLKENSLVSDLNSHSSAYYQA